MKFDNRFFSKVNKALAKEFGEGNVWLTPDPDGEYDYLLEFNDENVDWDTLIEPAKEFIKRFDPDSYWHDDKMRTADVPYYDKS